jgi:glutathione peroxidase
MTTAYDFTADDIDGHPQSLSQYAGKVLLIVNVASQCGFTPQYTGLEKLWRDYRARGLVVLGFPCDQFGHQEPGDAAGDQEFLLAHVRRRLPVVRQGRGQRRPGASAVVVVEG